MDEEKRHPFAAKWFLNGFPKSGLHLLELMMITIAEPEIDKAGLLENTWAGTFMKNTWTNEWMPLQVATKRMGCVEWNHYLKSHSGYKPEIEQFLFHLGVSKIFIYRDFRDVAISQAYHIMDPDEDRFSHPGRDAYRGMGFDEVLEAVIIGMGEYPGVMERWALYVPWLDVDWVHSVRFEDARNEPETIARGIIDYALARWQIGHLHEVQINHDAVTATVLAMAANSRLTELSPTFRKGNVGDWRREFKSRHRRLFKETDKDGWLVRLGYEEDDRW